MYNYNLNVYIFFLVINIILTEVILSLSVLHIPACNLCLLECINSVFGFMLGL